MRIKFTTEIFSSLWYGWVKETRLCIPEAKIWDNGWHSLHGSVGNERVVAEVFVEVAADADGGVTCCCVVV